MKNFNYKKSLGQHFIKNPDLHDKIVGVVNDIENSTILEIGPGDGGLSDAILRRNPKELIMIEKDQELIPFLQQKFAQNLKTRIIEGDATLIDFKSFATKKIKLIANLPYNVATNLILTWLENIDLFESITVLIQKEVANRFLAKLGDKDYCRTTVLMNFAGTIKKEFDIAPGAFTPPPKVDSTLITISPHKEEKYDISWDKLSKITKIAFSNPRKTIFNNLKVLNLPNLQLILQEANLNKNLRPENLSIKNFILLSKYS